MIRCMYCGDEATKFYMYSFRDRTFALACCNFHTPPPDSMNWKLTSKEEYLIDQLKRSL